MATFNALCCPPRRRCAAPIAIFMTHLNGIIAIHERGFSLGISLLKIPAFVPKIYARPDLASGQSGWRNQLLRKEFCMASHHPRRSRKPAIPATMPIMTERQTQAYLMARETLRRIERSSALAFRTSDAVKMQWSGSQLGRKVDGAGA